MKLMDRVRTAFKLITTRGFEDYDDAKYREYLNGPLPKSGVYVNQNSVMTLSAIFCGLNVIAGIVASLPKGIYRRLRDGGAEKAVDHPLYDRLRNKPNSFMTSWDWVFCQVLHKYLWGNWYTWIVRPTYSSVELLPLLPDVTYRDQETGRYVTEIKGKLYNIPASNVLHIPHITLNGINGRGFIHFARESLGIAKALDVFAGSFFGKGVNPGGFVEVDKPMEPEVRQNHQEDFNKKYGGLGSIFKVIWLTGGAKYHKEDIDAEKMQALESRQFSVLEAARWLNLPPHILKDLNRATFSNIEQQYTELVVLALTPLITQIEQAMNIAFLDDEERMNYYVKFELKGLLRGDLKARTEFYTSMLDRGVFNADDVLSLEDENPQPNGLGKKYFVPLNTVDKESVISSPIQSLKSVSEKKEIPISIEKRSSTLRRKLTIAYKPKFKEVANRIMEKEITDIRSAIEELLAQKKIADFNAWIETYYKDFGKEIEKLAAPLISSYATSVLPVVQEEIKSESDIVPQYEIFQRDYRGSLAKRHVISSKNQLKSIITNAQAEGIPVIDAVKQRLVEWEGNRADKLVLQEAVRAENAFTRSVFSLCGIKKVRSVKYGAECPYCDALAGKIIGIDEYFLQKGDFLPEGADTPLTITQNCCHAPYHDGCECGIEAAV